VPLYRETVVLFCNDRVMAAPHQRFPEDFAGLQIGVNAGFLLSGRLMDAAHAGMFELEPAKGNETNLRKLAAGRIDCYASDRLAAMYSARKLGAELGKGKFTLREAVELSGENTYIAYSMHSNPPYKADFVKKMNDVLQAMKKSGEIEQIEAAYRQE
jgi:polar amino acid transport system substrate-binding protein